MDYGRFTSSYRINIRIRARALDLSIAYSIQTSMSCTFTIKSGTTRRIQDTTDAEWCRSGSVCLDVINQTWSPMYDMVNIFEVFLPQLLRYPNPTDPLNGEAAALMMRDPKSYDAKVKGMFTGCSCMLLWHQMLMRPQNTSPSTPRKKPPMLLARTPKTMTR